MSKWIGMAGLRRSLSRYLRRVERGQSAVSGTTLDQLIAEGRVSRPSRRGLPKPLRLDGDPYALSRALSEVRGGER
jgi:hypothetical protein